MQTSEISTRFLVGGLPRNSPKLVPRDVNRLEPGRDENVGASGDLPDQEPVDLRLRHGSDSGVDGVDATLGLRRGQADRRGRGIVVGQEN